MIFERDFLNSVNNSENRIFSGETTVLCIRTIFWHILAKSKKNPQNGFFAKSKGIFYQIGDFLGIFTIL